LQDKTAELRQRFRLALTSLEAGSPQAILERGFSVTINGRTGKVLRRTSEAKAGDTLSIRLLEGYIGAVVEEG
jgi:exodeoxyribonuclease VII large subunit